MDGPDWLAKFIRWVMRDATYLGQYVCEVQGQDADGLLALLPDDAKVRGNGLGAVPIRHGLPGCKVFVKSGARVLLGWENGDPAKPFASLWSDDQDVVQHVELPGDKRPVARKGDPVIVFINPLVPIVMNGTVGGAPFVGTIQITTPVNGMIQEGNPKVLA